MHHHLQPPTLAALQELAAGFMSGKLMLKLEAISFLMTHHTAEHFPFLGTAGAWSNRTLFYCTLARLLFTEDTLAKFKAFVAPLQQVCGPIFAFTAFSQLASQGFCMAKFSYQACTSAFSRMLDIITTGLCSF